MPPRPLKILVAIDFAPLSLRALDHAVSLARRAPCELHLAHVIDAGAHVDKAELVRDYFELEQVAGWGLKGLATVEESGHLAAPQRHVCTGSPPAQLAALASRLRVDLIVMGYPSAVAVPSVAAGLLRQAPAPVLCITPEAARRDPIQWRNIACAVDFSDCSRAAVATASWLARHLEIELSLLHWRPSTGGAGLAQVELQLEEWRAQASGEAKAPRAAVLLATAPGATAAADLAEHARRSGCDLLVVGAHGQGHALLGPVAEALVRSAPCPVVTVP